MHLSTHNWMRAEPLEVTLKRIKKAGYESIEISGEPDQYPIAETQTLLKKYKIRCWGSVTLTLGKRNLLAKSPKQRADTVKYMKDVVSLASALGGEMITLVPATVGKVVAEASPEEEWQWAIDGCTEVYEWGLKKGVKIGIEPLNRFETYFITRCEQALALAKAVGKHCGVCLDVFHMNMEESDMHVAIEKAGSRLYDFHVADNNRFAPGMGDFEWKKIVRTLKKTGYKGALTVEFVAPVDRTPANKFPKAVEKNPVDISPEQLKFIQDHGSSVLSEEFYTMLVKKSAKTLLPLIK